MNVVSYVDLYCGGDVTRRCAFLESLVQALVRACRGRLRQERFEEAAA